MQMQPTKEHDSIQSKTPSPIAKKYPTKTAQSVSQALNVDSVSVDLLSAGVDVAKGYAAQVVWDYFNGNATAKLIISGILNYAVTSFKSLNPWISTIAQVLTTLASVPTGVVSSILWAIGKIWLWIANKFYNGSWLAKAWGDIDETYIFTWLNKGETAHIALQYVVSHLQDWIKYIEDKLASKVAGLFGVKGTDENDDVPVDDTAGSETQSKEMNAPNFIDNQFISLGINQPKLADWDNGSNVPKRAGIEGSGVAKINLLGQQFGGDINMRIPFGSGWEVSVAPVFASQEGVGFSGFITAHQVLGDELVLSDEGLTRFQASIIGLNIADERVYSDKLALDYNKQQKEVHFSGDAHVPLWDKKKLDGEFDLKLDTAGKFKSARAKLASSDSFEVIPNYLSVSNPVGEVEVHKEAAPEFEVGTDIALYGLPAGVKASVTQAKILYRNKQLGGEIAQADIEIPISKHTTMTLAMTKAAFSKDKIEAEKAYMNLEHDTSKELNKKAIVGADFFSGNFDFGKVFELKQLKMHQGLTSIKFENGKFSYEKDDNNGLQLLRARLLGLEAYYDNEKQEGGVEGEWSKGIEFPAFSLDFPVGAGFAGVGVDIKGGFEFGAGIGASVAHRADKKTDSQMFFSVAGTASASAKAKARIEAGAFVGVPYLAKVQGGLFGEIRGVVKGEAGVTGGLKYTRSQKQNSFGHFGIDNDWPMTGNFSLTGALEAEVGASLKAKVLTFEKELASVTLGDWTLGEYKLAGTMSKTADGKGYKVAITDGGFSDRKPKPVEITKQPLGVDKWIAQLEKEGRHIKYSSSEARHKLTEVARKTVYGHFSPALKQNVSERYSDLLTSISQRNEFNKIYQTLKSEREKLPISGTYIWTSKVWNEAVDRKKIFIFEKSQSKAKVAAKLDAYHKSQVLWERRNLLSDLKEITTDYRYNKSKKEENKQAAEEFLESIDKERLVIM